MIPQKSLISNELLLVTNLETQIKDFVEVAERSSLVQLKLFLRRCIDVITFLEYIEREIDNQKLSFDHLMRELGPELQDRLSKEEYQDFVVKDSNQLVRKLLEKTN